MQSSAANMASSSMAHHDQPTPRGILRLSLQTSHLPELRRFYADTLQLPTSGGDYGLTIHAGSTTLDFSPAPGDPCYHFAFNIPENKLALAGRWLTSRGVEVLKGPDGRDEYHFPSWNAHALYFLDPAGNILEFIARHNLPNAAPGDFSPADILYASEIGIVVDDVRAAADAARSALDLHPYANPPSDAFAAVGDELRLLIIVRRGRAWNIGDHRAAAIHPALAILAAPVHRTLSLTGLPYQLAVGPDAR